MKGKVAEVNATGFRLIMEVDVSIPIKEKELTDVSNRSHGRSEIQIGFGSLSDIKKAIEEFEKFIK